ncbi:MAG: flagellar assembly protein T N-terminal domain-containing protein [Halanaerobiaceae bacterium]
MRKLHWILLSLLLLSFLISLPPALAAETVTSEGRADIYDNNESQARDEALQDAFSKAVEKAAGVFIQSSTLMENMQVLKDQVLSEAQGYISNYNIISENKKDQIYSIKIRAEVSQAELEDNLEELGYVLRTRGGNPRVMIIVEEENAGKTSFFSVFGSKLSSVFNDIGFNLVHEETIESIQNKETLKKIIEGDRKAATALGKSYEAEIIIYGRTFTEFSGKRNLDNGALYTMQANADVQAVTAQDGTVITSINKSRSSYAPSKNRAGNRALKELSDKINGELVREIVSNYNRSSGKMSLRLVARELNFEQLEHLEKILGKTRGVDNYNMLSFSGKTAEYDLDISHEVKTIARSLNNTQELDITINEIQANRLEIKVN